MRQVTFSSVLHAVKRHIWILLTAGLLMYALSPIVGNQLGTVKPINERSGPLEFTLSALDGSRWSLAEHRGKVVLVNFWATWCPPCRIETPDLVDTHNALKDRGFTVVGVSLDEDPQEAVPQFVKWYGVPYPILLPAPGVGDQISSLPTSILLDRNGRVARTYVGIVTEAAVSKDVQALLNEERKAGL